MNTFAHILKVCMLEKNDSYKSTAGAVIKFHGRLRNIPLIDCDMHFRLQQAHQSASY